MKECTHVSLTLNIFLKSPSSEEWGGHHLSKNVGIEKIGHIVLVKMEKAPSTGTQF
jgi:hypothetical protein